MFIADFPFLDLIAILILFCIFSALAVITLVVFKPNVDRKNSNFQKEQSKSLVVRIFKNALRILLVVWVLAIGLVFVSQLGTGLPFHEYLVRAAWILPLIIGIFFVLYQLLDKLND